jgi:hypothetical protein
MPRTPDRNVIRPVDQAQRSDTAGPGPQVEHHKTGSSLKAATSRDRIARFFDRDGAVSGWEAPGGRG